MTIIDEIKDILRRSARNKKPISYGDLSREIERKTGIYIDPHESEMAGILGKISTEEYHSGRGMLSVLVVRKDNWLPGGGFFELAEILGEDISKDSSEDTKILFMTEQFNKVTDYYSK